MRRIDPSRAVLVFWSDLVFHEAALLADDEAKHLAAPVSQALDEFNTILKIDLDTRRGELKASARASIADAHLNDALRKLHNATLFLVGQDRKQPQFKTLFSESIDKVIRFALKRQIEVAADIVGKLALKLYTDDFKTTHVGLLQPLIDHGKTIVQEVRGAALARTEARLDVRAWKDNANAIRLANYGELVAIAGRTGRKKDWADAFFLSNKTAPVDDTDEQGDEDDPDEA
ncbi:MAG: hypothetical protein IPM54_26275 [Polyangiaceae bacterium]|nr:hypothetical protein [Polyangiaceae bacterium]